MTLPNALLRHLSQSVLLVLSVACAAPALAATESNGAVKVLPTEAVSVTLLPDLQAGLEISVGTEEEGRTADRGATGLPTQMQSSQLAAEELGLQMIPTPLPTEPELLVAETSEASTPSSTTLDESAKTEDAAPIPDVAADEVPVSEDVTGENSNNQDLTREAEQNTEVEAEEEEAASVLSPEELAQQQMLIEADNLFLSGQKEAAEALYRQAKDPFFTAAEAQPRPEAFSEPDQLSPGGKVYWRESAAGLEKNLKTRALVPASLLVERHPEFIPGHLRYAEALRTYQQLEEGLAVLERGAARHANEPELQQKLIDFQVESKRWLEASITARQFALLNPEHPRAEEFKVAAEKYQTKFRKVLRSQVRSNAIGGVLTGALNLALTGNPFSAVATVQSSVFLLRGEDSVGRSASERAKKRFEMIDDPEVQAYVDRIGQRLVAVAGRDMEYEFNVIKDEALNAFALPGGKIFINGGAITKSRSEAELAGLIAHELSHSVLSHGFQLVSEGNATAGLTNLVPLGGLFSSLVISDYSRDMEEQADLLGTRLLTSSGYAADGFRNLMVTLGKEDTNRSKLPEWLSSHPGNQKRVKYLEELIEKNGYNRYTYEGVADHIKIQERVQIILDTLAEEEQTLDQEVENLKDQQELESQD